MGVSLKFVFIFHLVSAPKLVLITTYFSFDLMLIVCVLAIFPIKMSENAVTMSFHCSPSDMGASP